GQARSRRDPPPAVDLRAPGRNLAPPSARRVPALEPVVPGSVRRGARTRARVREAGRVSRADRLAGRGPAPRDAGDRPVRTLRRPRARGARSAPRGRSSLTPAFALS